MSKQDAIFIFMGSYAKTDEEIQPNGSYLMSGNRISVKTLDLNCEFERIVDQLDEIVNNIF